MSEMAARQNLVQFGRYLGERGLAPGGSGNLSVKLDIGYLATPTGSRLAFLDTDKLALLDPQGQLISGAPPSKEIKAHLAFYRARPDCRAVVHLHAPCATALSCLSGLDTNAPLPALTPYFVMRVGRLGLLPYFMPGSDELIAAVEAATAFDALLLRHHGFFIGGKTLDNAVANAEELEETARIFLSLPDNRREKLTPEQIKTLEQNFRGKER